MATEASTQAGREADEPLLRMRELAEASGVSAGTIKHYLREGLLPEPVRTSRNMAWYPASFVERIQLIKRLQEERFLPLKVIRSMLDEDPDRVRSMVEFEDRLVGRALELRERGRVSRRRVADTYGVPRNVLDRLEELGVLTPTGRGYDQDDVKIVEAIGRFRASGYDEALGFTVYDTLRYRDALAPLVAEEARVLRERLAGRVDPEEAVRLVEGGVEPLRDLLGAMHAKLLLAELRGGEA